MLERTSSSIDKYSWMGLVMLVLMFVGLNEKASAQNPPQSPIEAGECSTSADANETPCLFSLGDLSNPSRAQPEVAGAKEVKNYQEWRTVFFAMLKSKELCTHSLVGERVLLTAAHCVTSTQRVRIIIEDIPYSAKCKIHPNYRTNPSADYALCLLNKAVQLPRTNGRKTKFETLNLDPNSVLKNLIVDMTGFGCDRKDLKKEGSKVFRIGQAKVKSLAASPDNYLFVSGKATLCFGDSGGPTFFQGSQQNRKIVAINSMRDDDLQKNGSWLSSTSTKMAKFFLTHWIEEMEKEHDYKFKIVVCGHNGNNGICR